MKQRWWALVVAALFFFVGFISLFKGDFSTFFGGLAIAAVLTFIWYDRYKKVLASEANAADERLRVQAQEDARVAAAQQALQRISTVPVSFCNDPLPKRSLEELSTVSLTNITPRGIYAEFVVIDTETNGLDADDAILEIAAVRFRDGKAVEVFETLVDPRCTLNQRALSLNGIDPAELIGKPTIEQVMPAFDAFVGGRDVVAHNMEFDLKMLHRNGSRLIDKKRRYLCTLRQAQRIVKGARNYKLATLCQYYGIVMPETHRAKADAYCTGELFLRLVREKQV